MAEGLWAVNSIVLGRKAGQTATMWSLRHLLMVFGAFSVLVSCAPLSIYHKEGAQVTRMQTDLLDCEIAALSDVPVNNQIRQEPPIYVPARRYCDAAGRCHSVGGYFEQGRIYTVDLNADLRGRAEAQCMAQRGYQPVTLPNCPSNVFRAAPKTETRVLPRLTEQSCAIKYQDGSWQIVNQAG
ncbi:hypothetical protein [Roseobacter sp.]|uniref:hypothetical protein n=1 Tax=Roseobacter sp. TaxID=1907202 RepID=UPI0038585D23